MPCKKITITENGGEAESSKPEESGRGNQLLTKRNIAIAGVALAGVGLLSRR